MTGVEQIVPRDFLMREEAKRDARDSAVQWYLEVLVAPAGIEPA